MATDDDEPRIILGLAAATTLLDLVGARIATRHQLIGEPFRVTVPDSLPESVVLVAWGTALSGPLAVDGLLLVLARRSAHRAVAALAMVRLAGVLAEPVSWGRRPPRWTMVVSAAHVYLATQVLRHTRRAATVG